VQVEQFSVIIMHELTGSVGISQDIFHEYKNTGTYKLDPECFIDVFLQAAEKEKNAGTEYPLFTGNYLNSQVIYVIDIMLRCQILNRTS
jgi:hypothetical protein